MKQPQPCSPAAGAHGSIDTREHFWPSRDMRQECQERLHELLVIRVAHIVAVQILELDEIEARRRPADAIEIEPVDHLVGREDLIIAMAPAEPGQIVAHRFRQIAHGAIGLDAKSTMTL